MKADRQKINTLERERVCVRGSTRENKPRRRRKSEDRERLTESR